MADCDGNTSSMLSDGQLRKIRAKLHSLGLTDRDEMLAVAAEIIGFDVKSLTDLTRSQAAQVIDALVEREEASRLQVVDRSEVADLPTITFVRVGEEKAGIVAGPPVLVQATNYYSGAPSFDRSGRPKMNLVVTLNIGGERYALWAPKPSAMYAAIQDSEKELGRPLKPLDLLQIKFIGEIPNRNPQFNAAKQYKAKVIE